MSGMVGSGSGMASSYYGSRAEASVLRREEAQSVIEANQATEESALRTKQLLAEQRTLYAKAGVDITSGSPLSIMADTAAKGELEKERIAWAETEKWKMLRWRAHVIKHGGDVAMSENATSLTAQIIGSIAGGIAGGATEGIAGGVTGAMTGSGGGGYQGVGSFMNWLSNRKSSVPDYGLGTYSRRG